MASIVIEDLVASAELDSQAMAALVGGYRSGFGWIRPYRRSSNSGSFNYPVVNQYYTLNQFIADEIQIINQEQFVNINNSAGAQVDLNESAQNGLGKNALIPELL